MFSLMGSGIMNKLIYWCYRRLPRVIRVKANELKAEWAIKHGKRGPTDYQWGKREWEDLKPGEMSSQLKAICDGKEYPGVPSSLTHIQESLQLDGHLTAQVFRKDGSVEYYDLGHNTVTNAGVAFLVDDWFNGSTDITNLNFHAMGTGGSPPSTPPVTQTGLVTEVETRSAGTKSKPAANQIRTVATISATAARAINEWGLFSAATAGTLWSTRWFPVINLSNGDSIEFTYTLTVSSFTA